jgi:alpha-1,2-mannosyltransferase
VKGELWELLRPPLQGLAGVLLVAVGAAIISGQTSLWHNTVDDRDAQDFGIFLNSARTFAAGGSLYPAASIRNRGLYRTGQLNLNLPHTHLILLPLVALTARAALTVWIISSLVVLMLCAWSILHALRWHLPALLWLAIGVYLLAWGPAAAFSLTAQISLLLAGPVTAAWLAWRQGRHRRAGLWLGFAAAIKPFLLIFLAYFAVRRDWRALQGFALSAAITIGAGVLVFGVIAYGEWLSQLPRIHWATHYFNASITGAAERVFGRSFYAIAGHHAWIARTLILIGVVVVAGLTFRHLVRHRTAADVASIDRDWAVMLLASLLLSPLGWVYYLWIAVGPIAAAIGHSEFWRSPRRIDVLLIPGLAGWLWYGKMTEWGQPNPLATATFASMYFWALLSLWAWTISDVRPRKLNA